MLINVGKADLAGFDCASVVLENAGEQGETYVRPFGIMDDREFIERALLHVDTFELAEDVFLLTRAILVRAYNAIPPAPFKTFPSQYVKATSKRFAFDLAKGLNS